MLDLDGTLLELLDRPEQVVADAGLRDLLRALDKRLGGRVAVISGRSIAQIDAILGDVALDLAVAGSHGLEERWQGEVVRPDRPEALDIATERLRSLVESRPGVLLEEKALGVALHYRMDPSAEVSARALARALSEEFDLHLQPGKMMVELHVGGGDKGTAVARLMTRTPFAGTIPVFIGDDLTDEPAFAAARHLGGHGILIGSIRPTAAEHALASPAALRAWLAGALA